jgi:hypothetical protein
MKKMDSKNIDVIINKMKKMLNEKELGIKINFGGARYDADSFKVTLEVSLPNAKTKEEKHLEALMRMRNANPKYYRDWDLTKIIKIKGVDYTLNGYTNRPNSKKPFIILNLLNNKQYLITEEQVDRLFGDPTWVDTLNFNSTEKGVSNEIN